MSVITQQILEDLENLPSQMQQEALDFICSLSTKLKKEASKKEPNGTRLAQLMEEMSKKNLFSDIKDPVAWQREIRRDRPLPGRDDG